MSLVRYGCLKNVLKTFSKKVFLWLTSIYTRDEIENDVLHGKTFFARCGCLKEISWNISYISRTQKLINYIFKYLHVMRIEYRRQYRFRKRDANLGWNSFENSSLSFRYIIRIIEVLAKRSRFFIQVMTTNILYANKMFLYTNFIARMIFKF